MMEEESRELEKIKLNDMRRMEGAGQNIKKGRHTGEKKYRKEKMN